MNTRRFRAARCVRRGRDDGEGPAGDGAAGSGRVPNALSESVAENQISAGVVADDPAGAGGSGGGDCGEAGGEPVGDLPDGGAGVQADRLAEDAGQDGGGDGVRGGVYDCAAAGDDAGGAGGGAAVAEEDGDGVKQGTGTRD
jgi:hypothetical protein